MKSVFVTGTDTGVGKTLISTTLIKYCLSQGLSVAPMKPVASGAIYQNNKLVNEDALSLIEASKTELEYSVVNPYVFEEPVAPHIAANKNNSKIDVNQLNKLHHQISANVDRVVIEGAGGWQVPLTKDISMADWVAQNKWPVILVVGLRLGCINHARLSYLDILAKQSPLAGWVINTIDPDVLVPDAIIADLKQYIEAPLFGVVPWLENESDAAQYLDFSPLM